MPADYPSFLTTRMFDADWAAAGLADSDLRTLQLLLGADPEAGDVMRGTGGLRKVRFARPGMGKSGGIRACYAYFPAYGVFYLYLVVRKNERANLNQAQRNQANAALVVAERLLAVAKRSQDAANATPGERNLEI